LPEASSAELAARLAGSETGPAEAAARAELEQQMQDFPDLPWWQSGARPGTTAAPVTPPADDPDTPPALSATTAIDEVFRRGGSQGGDGLWGDATESVAGPEESRVAPVALPGAALCLVGAASLRPVRRGRRRAGSRP